MKQIWPVRRSHLALALLMAASVIAAMLVSADRASADSTQLQSYQRSHESEPCSGRPEDTPWQASWGVNPGWGPSWEQWPNGGTGGWTCTRSITWARSTGQVYGLGDIGPGGGLVFLISGGLRYEMAPKSWNGGGSDPTLSWSGNTVDILFGTSSAIGSGTTNTSLIINMDSGGSTAGRAATSASSYRGGGLSDWFLPSSEELNAMCNYSRTWVTAPSSGTCTGPQDSTFASGAFGFASGAIAGRMWSSTDPESSGHDAYRQLMDDGSQGTGNKATPLYVRPIRAF